MKKTLEFLKEHWKKALIGTIVVLAVFAFPIYQSVLNWYYDREIIERVGDITEDSFRSDSNWLNCIYNCALQVDPVQPGLCIARCDRKFQEVP